MVSTPTCAAPATSPIVRGFMATSPVFHRENLHSVHYYGVKGFLFFRCRSPGVRGADRRETQGNLAMQGGANESAVRMAVRGDSWLPTGQPTANGLGNEGGSHGPPVPPSDTDVG